MIPEGTRVKIKAVGKNDAFYGDGLVGRTGVVGKLGLRRDHVKAFHFGPIILDKTETDDLYRYPWFAYVQVKVIEEASNAQVQRTTNCNGNGTDDKGGRNEKV